MAATDDGESGAAASQTKAPSPEAGLNLLGLQHGDEPGEPLSYAGGDGFAGASPSGSGASGTGSGGLLADSGGSPPISEEPPPGAWPPISEEPPTGAWPPISDGPPTGAWPPISDGPPIGAWPPISDSPPSGASPPIPEGPSTGVLPLISVGGTVSLLLDTTLDQLTGLHLVETVGGLLDTVDDTLSQITGLVGNAGELTAVVGGVASSLGTLVSTVGDLSLLGDVGHLSAVGTASQVVHTASSLVEDAGNILNGLPGGLTDALSTSGMGAPALDIVSDASEIAPLAHGQDVSSGGTISFPDLTGVNVLQVDDLFAGGRYTDYGLAVQSGVNSGSTAIADPLGGDTANSSVNSPIDSPTDGHEPAVSPGVQDVTASHVSLPSIIEDLGVRDLSI
jgi:hypothetical protein